MYVTYSKSKGKVFNYQFFYKYCLMKRILHTPSPEIVSTSSDVSQNKFSLENISLDIKLMTYILYINLRKLSRKCGKAFTKRYALKIMILTHFGQFYRNIHAVVKLLP